MLIGWCRATAKPLDTRTGIAVKKKNYHTAPSATLDMDRHFDLATTG